MDFLIPNDQVIQNYRNALPQETQEFLDAAVKRIVDEKQKGGKVIVATGSGPNLHEGVTTLIAELIRKGIVDGVTTSSAVIAHELAGTLDRVKRLDGKKLGLDVPLPNGDIFEFTQMPETLLKKIAAEMDVDLDLIERGSKIDGNVIIKAAGNMAYPMGLRTERIAREIMAMAHAYGLPFETTGGWGADPLTMIGAAARRGVPALVSVPQLIGGGGVGLAVGDSITISQRCMHMAEMIDSAGVIIESAVALTQELHDGPFETFTGHGIWAHWDGYRTTSLKEKGLIRIDLDPNLKRAWELQRQGDTVQAAIDKGLPKTKLTGIPFRMEMSGFARLPGSIPVTGDIGVVWPVMAYDVACALGIKLDFISHPQQTPEGQAMRNWIVENIQPFDRDLMHETGRNYRRTK
ncbi:MAG: hypothetical protein GX491_13830 [Chloroflexi bacterium]|nr:hypothetical protein [Chloroflexota bacterium]